MTVKLERMISVTDFLHNAKSTLKELQEVKEPLILTNNGKFAAVILDADTFQHLWQFADAHCPAESSGSLADTRPAKSSSIPQVELAADVQTVEDLVIRKRGSR